MPDRKIGDVNVGGYVWDGEQWQDPPKPTMSPLGLVAPPKTSGEPMISGPNLIAAAKQIPGIVGNVGLGAAKGVGDTGLGAVEMLDKGASLLSGGTMPVTGRDLIAKGHAALQPHGVAQNVGKVGADIGMFAALPEGSLPTALLENGALAGAQSGGDPLAMGLGAATGGLGYGIGKGMGHIANETRLAPASQVVDPMLKSAYKGQPGGVVPPEVLEATRQKFADLIKKYGLEGNAGDTARIASSKSDSMQENLGALSNNLAKPREFSNLWSMLMSATLVPASIGAGGPVGGVEALAPIILAARSLLNKYPGKGAKALDELAPLFQKAMQSGGAASGQMNRDPLEQALSAQEQVK